MSICGSRSRISHFAGSTFAFGTLVRCFEMVRTPSIQLLLFLGYPGIGVARDAEPQITRLLARLEGRARHQLGFQRTEGPTALDPHVARAQAVAQHGEGGDFPVTPVPLAVGSDQFSDLLLEMADRHFGRQRSATVPIELSQKLD